MSVQGGSALVFGLPLQGLQLFLLFLNGSFVCVGVKLLGIFIAAVIVEVSGVHNENQFPIFHRIGFQTTPFYCAADGWGRGMHFLREV